MKFVRDNLKCLTRHYSTQNLTSTRLDRTDRRRYEDSTDRLKAVQEREIDGKKMRTTWNRQNKEDEGQHESICSSGSPEEFEALWQQTPFGEAQKMKVKGNYSRSRMFESEVASTAAALQDTSMKETPVGEPKASVTKEKSASTEKDKMNDSETKDRENL
ncbi:hypothetical protein F441_14350 [Phytophthora nicotianae CJ01A1]|uniref:Uncharacterized protein n=1 Tax=Phytophthora nicotianae CJ01A1 TaxID=1317063 RepID=W2WIG3_PHYNI|nr:hypothetical protein F441_14350 [Phytophthora nicotianae CJ01A1]